MRTIKTSAEIIGKALMDATESKVKITPSDKEGIYFYPENSEEPVKACLDNVISTQNCVVLGSNNKQVRLVEHFMAACAFAGIDSLNVYMSGIELPILEGSSLEWFKLFNEAGIDQKSCDNNVTIDTPIYYSLDKASLVMIPAESFQISYCVNFNHPDLKLRWFKWSFDDNQDEILQARTFGYLKDLEMFQKAGLALGVSIDNTVGLTETGYTTELRSEYEPIKHKILDLIGDLILTGVNPLSLKAHIIVQNAGHKTHFEFAKILKKELLAQSCLCPT